MLPAWSILFLPEKAVLRYNTSVMFTRPFPLFFVGLIIAIALANGLAMFFFWYWTFRWLDMVMHALAGFWIGGAALWWYYFAKRNEGRIRKRTPHYVVAFAVGAAVLVGLLWEGFEIGLDMSTGRSAYDVVDTISDLLFDAAGGLAVGCYFVRARYHRS